MNNLAETDKKCVSLNQACSENNQTKNNAPQESGELTVDKTANRNPKVGNGQCGEGNTKK